MAGAATGRQRQECCDIAAVVEEIRAVLAPGAVIVNKSTVPVGTAARTAELLGRDDVAVVSNPEFLREGSAVHDFMHPDRIVVGAQAPEAAERVAALFARRGAPTVLTDAASAELIKYAMNCFLAMKLSYATRWLNCVSDVNPTYPTLPTEWGFDLRDSPALAVAALLRQTGAELTADDPGVPATGLGSDARRWQWPKVPTLPRSCRRGRDPH